MTVEGVRKLKKNILIGTLIIGTGIIIGIPLLLNIPWVAEKVSWYFSGLKTPDYKMTYISLLGGIIGVWLTVGTTLLIQMIFDSGSEKERKRMTDYMISEFFLDEIKQNHKALVTCDSPNHKYTAKDKSVLDLINCGIYGEIGDFSREFSMVNWSTHMSKLYELDKEAYMILAKLYECYKSVYEYKVASINKKAKFEKSGIMDYEKHYEKFEKRFSSLLETENYS